MLRRKSDGCVILSIDAWRDSEGGWQWNSWYDTGLTFPYNALDNGNRKIINELRNEYGILSEASKGKVTIEDDGYNLVVIDRKTQEPLFAIEYGNVDLD